MDLDNPYLAPTAEIVPEGPRSVPPKSFKEAIWRGTKTGLKWMTFIVGPFALLMLLFWLGVMIFAMFSDTRRMAVSENLRFYLRMLWDPVAAYLLFCLYGSVIGAVIGGILHMARGFQAFLRRRKVS